MHKYVYMAGPHSPISPSAGKHLVDAEHVEGVGTDPDVEGVLTRRLGHVLVASNATSLEGLGGDLGEAQ